MNKVIRKDIDEQYGLPLKLSESCAAHAAVGAALAVMMNMWCWWFVFCILFTTICSHQSFVVRKMLMNGLSLKLRESCEVDISSCYQEWGNQEMLKLSESSASDAAVVAALAVMINMWW